MQACSSQSWLTQKLAVTLQEQTELVVLEARLQGIKRVAGGAGAEERGTLGEGWQEMERQRWHLEGLGLREGFFFFFDRAWERLLK